MMRSLMTYVVLGLLVLPSRGLAQEAEGSRSSRGGRGGAGLSVLSGKTLGSASALHLQAGWPGLSLTYLGGVSDRLDFGARVGLTYAYEGIARLANVPGMKMQGVLRLELLERDRFNLGLRFSPGVFLTFFPLVTEVGLALPIDVVGGFALTPQTMVNFGLDLPTFVVFGPYSGVAMPVLFGAGIEHQLDSQLGLTFNMRAGPSVPLTGHGIYGTWGNYTCYDGRGRPFVCGGYNYQAPAVELLMGVNFRL